MLPTLPFQRLFQPIGNEASNWHDYYGAIAVLSEYAEYDYMSVTPMAYWSHGALFPFDTKFENALTLGVSRNKKLPIWLHREEHCEYFKQSSSVHSIGQAYTYVPTISERHCGSVLIMPGHSLWPDPTIDTSLFRKYVSDVARVYPPDEKTYVCLNTNCLRNGYWVTEFSEAGYTIIAGSRTDDSNAYLRMKTLFGHFETVVTNILGSHIVYAASEGCRVGIWGTEVIEDPSLDAGAVNIKRTPRDWIAMSQVECPFLYPNPGEEAVHQDWGRYVLGFQHKRLPAEVRSLLNEARDYHVTVRNKSKLIRRIKSVLRKCVRI